VRQVFCCDVIEHLTADQMVGLLEEIFRVLLPGGELILSTPNLNRFSNFVRFLSNHTVNPPITVSKVGDTYGHIRELAPKELGNLLWSRGFSTEALVYGLIPYFTFEAVEGGKPISSRAGRLINKLTRLLSRFRSSFGDEIYLRARRLF
jgi:SAM-dependent methyltransferase